MKSKHETQENSFITIKPSEVFKSCKKTLDLKSQYLLTMSVTLMLQYFSGVTFSLENELSLIRRSYNTIFSCTYLIVLTIFANNCFLQ